MFFQPKFKAPWEIPFPQRMQVLNSPRKKVIYFYEKPDSSTFRYRAYNMCQALEKSDTWIGAYFFENEISFLLPYLKEISVIIFCRTRWSFSFDQLIHQAKKENIPLLFDIDDLVFHLDKVPLVMNTLNISFREDLVSHWYSYAARLHQLGKKCHGTIGTNDYIASHLKDCFGTPNFVVPNFLNAEQINVSESLFLNKKRNSKYTLGYFSGSPSHANDFAKIAPEIASLLNTYPDMKLEVAGFMDFPRFLIPFVKKKRIVHTPFVDYLTLQKKIAAVDLNLVPLVDNEFTQCKSELKFFEAAIVGTPTLATPTLVYQQNIRHGKTGFLCEEGDWHPTVADIYNENCDTTLPKAAREYCLNQYSPENQRPKIERMLGEALCLMK